MRHFANRMFSVAQSTDVEEFATLAERARVALNLPVSCRADIMPIPMHEVPEDDPTLTLEAVLNGEGEGPPRAALGVDAPTLLRMYREMLRIRTIDERMLKKQRQGKVGFYGTITGQEATPIATAFALEPSDWVFPALREASIMLVRGFPLTAWLAQVYGNSADVQRGRQMPSHQGGRSVHQVAWSSCIGNQLPQAVGAAIAARQRGERMVAVAFMGDGATSHPDFHSAMTFASYHRAPVVLICQNNHWSISVPTARQTASRTLAIKAHAYDMAGVRVDGNDVLAVHRAIFDAATRAREGHGPTFIEAVTYRMGPHSSSDDPSRYREATEVEAWAKKDPIERFASYLRAIELLDDAAVARMRKELDAEFDAAVAEIEELGPPERDSLFTDVYASMPRALAAQQIELCALPFASDPHGDAR